MSKTILLADDSVTIRKVVELTFMDESFELRSVGSGQEALAQFQGDVDLVIADVHMPGPDGYEVCQEVKKRNPGTPVLLLVGTFETFDERKADEAGADDHLKKPFDSQDLLNRVHGLLANTENASEASMEPRGSGSPIDQVPAPVAEPKVEDQNDVTALGDSETESAEQAPGYAVEDDVAKVAMGPVDTGASGGETPAENLSDELVDRIARRVVELLSEDALREVAWEVIPDLAEVVIKERLSELESHVE